MKYFVWWLLTITMISIIAPFAKHKLIGITSTLANLNKINEQLPYYISLGPWGAKKTKINTCASWKHTSKVRKILEK